MIKYIRNGRLCLNVAHIAAYGIREIGGHATGVVAYPQLAPFDQPTNQGLYVFTTGDIETANQVYDNIIRFLCDQSILLDLTNTQRKQTFSPYSY